MRRLFNFFLCWENDPFLDSSHPEDFLFFCCFWCCCCCFCWCCCCGANRLRNQGYAPHLINTTTHPLLGCGTFGKVLLAKHKQTGSEVALPRDGQKYFPGPGLVCIPLLNIPNVLRTHSIPNVWNISGISDGLPPNLPFPWGEICKPLEDEPSPDGRTASSRAGGKHVAWKRSFVYNKSWVKIPQPDMAFCKSWKRIYEKSRKSTEMRFPNKWTPLFFFLKLFPFILHCRYHPNKWPPLRAWNQRPRNVPADHLLGGFI